MMKAPIILLVEDDAMLRDAFRLLLEDAGYEVHEAGTAAEALAAVNATEPSLILLDLGLPDRPGLEVVRILSQKPAMSRIPILALTGRTGEAEERACLEAGCTSFFAKPLAPRELLRSIPRFLETC